MDFGIGTYLKTWVIFIVVGSVGSFLLGALSGGVLGGIMGGLGYSVEAIRKYAELLGIAVGLPVWFFAFKWAVDKYIVQRLGERGIS